MPRTSGNIRCAGLVGGSVRHFTLDRTFVDDAGIRWIIDYKTGSHEGGNLEAFLNNEQANDIVRSWKTTRG